MNTISYDQDKLREELILHEGKRLTAYQDSLDYWTIGIGHLLGKKRTIKQITEQQCLEFFEEDIKDAEENLDRIIPFWRELDPVRQRVLMNMSFNLGGRLAQFKRFIKALDQRDFDLAVLSMRDSKWYSQVGNRAKYLCSLMRNADSKTL